MWDGLAGGGEEAKIDLLLRRRRAVVDDDDDDHEYYVVADGQTRTSRDGVSCQRKCPVTSIYNVANVHVFCFFRSSVSRVFFLFNHLFLFFLLEL